MNVFDYMAKDEHEQLIFCHEPSTGLRAIICIHSTLRGPALAGVRMVDYDSMDEAVDEAMSMARSMTFETAMAGGDLGGGACILWGDPDELKNEAYMRAFGRFVESLRGRVHVTRDIAITARDLAFMRRETQYVHGVDQGDTDVCHCTATGIVWAMKSCLKELFNDASLEGRVVAIQGAGSLGRALAKLVIAEGGKVAISDTNYDRLKRVKDENPEIKLTKPDRILSTKCDILAPCARGRLIAETDVDRLKCRVIAGGANDVLLDEGVAQSLQERKILYAPPFVTAAGRTIHVSNERAGLGADRSAAETQRIFPTLSTILSAAADGKRTPLAVALDIARERIESIGQLRRLWL